MRDLSISEIEVVNGAGRVLDSLTSFGTTVGEKAAGLLMRFVPLDSIPIIGGLAQGLVEEIVTFLFKGIGTNMGKFVGGQIENLLPFLK